MPTTIAKKKSLVTKPETVKLVTKTVKYVDTNIKISDRKLRLLVDQIKKLSPHQAADRLTVTNSKSARILKKAIDTIVADAQHNHNLSLESLVFKSIMVDQGIRFKRMDKSHGSRFNRGLIQKRHSRLQILVTGKTQNGSKS